MPSECIIYYELLIYMLIRSQTADHFDVAEFHSQSEVCYPLWVMTLGERFATRLKLLNDYLPVIIGREV